MQYGVPIHMLEAWLAHMRHGLCWQYARITSSDTSFCHCRLCCVQVLQQANNFSAINCSNTMWAFASLRHYSPALFAALLERMTDHLDEVEPQNVANSLYALARVNHPLGNHTGIAHCCLC